MTNLSIKIGDIVTTNLGDNYKNSPFNKVSGIVMEIAGNDYLLDLSINGIEFIEKCNKITILYGCDWDSSIPKTCKWFERHQISKRY